MVGGGGARPGCRPGQPQRAAAGGGAGRQHRAVLLLPGDGRTARRRRGRGGPGGPAAGRGTARGNRRAGRRRRAARVVRGLVRQPPARRRGGRPGPVRAPGARRRGGCALAGPRVRRAADVRGVGRDRRQHRPDSGRLPGGDRSRGQCGGPARCPAGRLQAASGPAQPEGRADAGVDLGQWYAGGLRLASGARLAAHPALGRYAGDRRSAGPGGGGGEPAGAEGGCRTGRRGAGRSGDRAAGPRAGAEPVAGPRLGLVPRPGAPVATAESVPEQPDPRTPGGPTGGMSA